MMEHYSHIRRRAKEAAIEALNIRNQSPEISGGWAQNWAQSKRARGKEGEKKSLILLEPPVGFEPTTC
jgi:hypothetical protein